MFPVKDRYDEVFNIEIEGWCYGLANYQGEVSPQVIHRIIRELSPSFQAAIMHNVVFNTLAIAEKFAEAAKYLIHPKEVAFAILAQLPNPAILFEEQQCILGLVIDQVEQTYPGALQGYYQRWNLGGKREAA